MVNKTKKKGYFVPILLDFVLELQKRYGWVVQFIADVEMLRRAIQLLLGPENDAIEVGGLG